MGAISAVPGGFDAAHPAVAWSAAIATTTTTMRSDRLPRSLT
jgi:hypothetical protein